jgi:sRNA-binding protein
VKLLAIGAGHLIWPAAKEAGIKRNALNDALQFRTNSVRYLKALAADGAMRCDLKGNDVEPVSPENRSRAIAMRAELAMKLSAKARP